MEKNDNLVNLDAETIVKLCENEEITIQPVTSNEISKLILHLTKTEIWRCRRFLKYLNILHTEVYSSN